MPPCLACGSYYSLFFHRLWGGLSGLLSTRSWIYTSFLHWEDRGQPLHCHPQEVDRWCVVSLWTWSSRNFFPGLGLIQRPLNNLEKNHCFIYFEARHSLQYLLIIYKASENMVFSHKISMNSMFKQRPHTSSLLAVGWQPTCLLSLPVKKTSINAISC